MVYFVSKPLMKKVVTVCFFLFFKPMKVPAPFTEEKQFITVPHTENVRMCGKCNGRGRNRCSSCHGKGYKRGSEGKSKTYVSRKNITTLYINIIYNVRTETVTQSRGTVGTGSEIFGRRISLSPERVPLCLNSEGRVFLFNFLRIKSPVPDPPCS